MDVPRDPRHTCTPGLIGSWMACPVCNSARHVGLAPPSEVMADILSRATERCTDPAAELRSVATALRSGQATAADADALEAAASELDRRPTTEVLGRIADAFDRRSFALERPAPETWPPAAVQARHGAAGAWGDAALALRGLFADPEWQLAAETILASLRELGRDACAAPSTETAGTPGA